MVGPINSVNPGAWRTWQAQQAKRTTKRGEANLQQVQAKAGEVGAKMCATVCQHAATIARYRASVASFVAGVVVATTATGATVALVNRANTASVSTPITIVTRITVKPGDTLWSLSQKYGSSDEHILNRVQALAKANGLKRTSTLIPGQRVLVPVSNPVEVARLQSRMARH